MSAHKNKRALKLVVLTLAILMLIAIAAQLFFTSKVKSILEEELPPSIHVTYETLKEQGKKS